MPDGYEEIVGKDLIEMAQRGYAEPSFGKVNSVDRAKHIWLYSRSKNHRNYFMEITSTVNNTIRVSTYADSITECFTHCLTVLKLQYNINFIYLLD